MDDSFFPKYIPFFKRQNQNVYVHQNLHVMTQKQIPLPDTNDGVFLENSHKKDFAGNENAETDSIDCSQSTYHLNEISPLVPCQIGNSFRLLKENHYSEFNTRLISSYISDNESYLLYPYLNSLDSSFIVKCSKLDFKKSTAQLSSTNVYDIETNGDLISVDSYSNGDCSSVLITSNSEVQFYNDKGNAIIKQECVDSYLHRMLPSYFCVTRKDGFVQVFDITKVCPLWINSVQRKFSSNSYSGARFGKHPLTMYACNGKEIFYFDMREYAHESQRLLFKLQDQGITEWKSIHSFIDSPNRPYLYINSYNSIFVVDERYHKTPVLIRNHMLMGGASSPQLIQNNNIDILALSDPVNGTISTTCLNWIHEGTFKDWIPEGTGITKHYPIFENSLTMAQRDNLFLNFRAIERWKSPKLGMTSVVDKNLVYFYTCNLYGDIFCQHFIQNSEKGSNIYFDSLKSLYSKYDDTVQRFKRELAKRDEIPRIAGRSLKSFLESRKRFFPTNKNLAMALDQRKWNVEYTTQYTSLKNTYDRFEELHVTKEQANFDAYKDDISTSIRSLWS